MVPLYIFALLIHTAFSSTPCQDGVEILTKDTKNPLDIIGNWTYVYHWDTPKFFPEFVHDVSKQCPILQITAATPEFVKAKEAECAKSKVPFNWADVKLKVDDPAMHMKGGIITLGENENWMTGDCTTMVRVVIKKVSDVYMVLTNPDEANDSGLISREIPMLEEVKCIAHNVDVGKGLGGFGLCFNN